MRSDGIRHDRPPREAVAAGAELKAGFISWLLTLFVGIVEGATF